MEDYHTGLDEDLWRPFKEGPFNRTIVFRFGLELEN